LLTRDIAEARGAGDPGGLADPLEKAVGHLQGATMWLAQNGMASPNNVGAGAYPYMQLMGAVTLGWMWLKIARASNRLKDEAGEDRAFHEAKLITARFYADRELANASGLRRKVEAGAESVMALPVDAF
ncbi:MAG: acyl-CoA dehydrogenase C-terminal domain-containing protein, partial [Sphingomicrobium sp.]